MTHTFTFHIERDCGPFDQRELALEVTYSINRYYPATHLQPAEGGDCEIISVLLDGEEFELTQAEEDRLQMDCQQDADERANDAAEYRAEQRRDEIMMEGWA